MVGMALAVARIRPRGWLPASGGVMVVVTGMFGLCPACAMVGHRPIKEPLPVIALDCAVFAAAQAGDPLALDCLLRELQPDIRRYARHPCHRSSVIEDVVQEALLVIYRRVGSVRDA